MSLNVCVYCGSRTPEDSRIIELADKIGNAIADHNWGLVYGGGKVGMMGLIADAALEKNGEVIGIIPTALKRAEVVHTGVTEVIETPDMHTRKALMEKKSSAFLVLPGGFGTLDEFFEILTWRQLGIHNKPIILLNAFGYFDGLATFVENAIDQDFVRANNRNLFSITTNFEETISVLEEKLKQ
ncbi:MAG: TIGR00730 family Rossman fold protein [Balneola sp.]